MIKYQVQEMQNGPLIIFFSCMLDSGSLALWANLITQSTKASARVSAHSRLRIEILT